MNQVVAKGFQLVDDGRDQRVQPRVYRTRSDHGQIDDVRHEAQQDHGGRVAIDKTRRLKQIGHSHLVGGQAFIYSIHHVCPVESNEGSRRAVSAHGIDEDHVLRFREKPQKREAKRTAVFQTHAWRNVVVTFDAGDRSSACPVVTQQDIAEP
ncbi:MAG: hypothetical protein WCA45_16160 [Thiobacillaceae bacterium]